MARVVRNYHTNNVLYNEYFVIKGSKFGEFRDYDGYGKIIESCSYYNSLKHGYKIYYNDYGKPMMLSKYNNDEYVEKSLLQIYA